MFSSGQIVFALIFIVVFSAAMIFVYRKDLKLHKIYYKGSIWTLIAFVLFISLLFILKKTFK